MEIFWWSLTAALMLAGLVGIFVPMLPGCMLILAGALVHRLAFGAGASVGNGALWVLLGLALLAQAVEVVSGTVGARWFGATRWGLVGGIVGGVIGLFFGLPGLILGPVFGVLLGEFVGGKGLLPAVRSTWGTVLGTVAGSAIKLGLALIMIAWFALALVLGGSYSN